MKFSELVSNAEVLQPGVFNRAVVEDFDISNLKVVDMLGVNTKIVSIEVQGSEKKPYKVVVQFNQADRGCTEESNVVVRCSCMSFRFWFSEANRKARALYGMHRPNYVPVPDNERVRAKRPPLNPGDLIPGTCKHICVAMKYMKREGIAR